MAKAKTVFFYDYKSTIKEYGDAKSVKVCYELLEEHGAPHDKTFVMRILIDGVDYGHGVGKSKKEAEQNACKMALQKIRQKDFKSKLHNIKPDVSTLNQDTSSNS